MFQRDALTYLEKWSTSPSRKPLILRGARQVGKTSLGHLLGGHYEQYIYLNLERPRDRKFFETHLELSNLLQALFLSKSLQRSGKKTLLFIDEIQEYPRAIALLRYFHEEHPDIHLIAAGSLLESIFNIDISFPVGRVSYLAIRPLSFQEFLRVLGEEQSIALLNSIPLPTYAHGHLLELFHTYTIIGGMPEIVSKYAQHKDISALQTAYDGILVPYLEDTIKYAKSTQQGSLLKHLLQHSFLEAGQRIKFEGFGNSQYKSKEVAAGLRILDKTFFTRLVYPTTETAAPLAVNTRKSPRLQVLDTGLVTYFSGVQSQLLGFSDFNDAYRGRIIEHIVYQELITLQRSVLHDLHFWVRDKKTATAELDVVYPYKGIIVPIEVKSGAAGTLRSLHQFIDTSASRIAVRFYAGQVRLEKHTTIKGTPFTLLNLPYFLVSKIEDYLDWALAQ